MIHRIRPSIAGVLFVLTAIAANASVATATAGEPATLVVNDYIGMDYLQEPVSFEVALDPARPVDGLGLDGVTSQVEVLAGTRAAAAKVRIWTAVDLKGPGQLRFTVGSNKPAVAPVPTTAEAAGPVPVGILANASLRIRVPLPGGVPTSPHAAGELKFPAPVASVLIPGPIAGLSLDGTTWQGSGYLDCRRQVEAIAWTWESGPVFQQIALTYRFTGGKSYRAQVRLYGGKPWVSLVEDSDLGDDSRFVMAVPPPSRYLMPTDADYDRWLPLGDSGSVSDGAEDFITIAGQRCLARLVIWSQHNYFRGKQEHLSVALPDAGGDLALGAFLCRPDRWTRVKVNHIDLYQRPQATGDTAADRMTRGRVGLEGSAPRLAFESWLTDGHRETGWYLRRVSAWKSKGSAEAQGQGAVPPAAASQDPFFTLAHVADGSWNLDRLNRQVLTWNADGSVPTLDDQRPVGSLGFSSDIHTVIKSTVGRCGMMRFNGSNPNIRSAIPGAAKALATWAKANPTLKGATALQNTKELSTRQAGTALICLMAMDDSAYPGPRAMLPWSDPEALNPFYQGMENMNFNTDRFNTIQHLAEALKELGCPWADLAHTYVEGQYRSQVDRYVYPQSGCWEESHTYAGSILRATREAGIPIRERGTWNPFADERIQRVHTFWPRVLFPRDPGFGGKRSIAPIGDHGGPNFGRTKALRDSIPNFLAAGTPAARATAAELAWMVKEAGEQVADLGIEPQRPPWKSTWLQGYGSILRAADTQARESMIIVRAEQSWGHHHQDKGSLWGWFKDVHFFGDCAWGSPPGGHYWNPYKQGPEGHTNLEFVGVNNWPLPCKYPAPWIADESYSDGADWCVARCRYPYNPPLDLSRSTPPALTNGYDRCVLFIHPDILVVRDEVDSPCPTIWRLHSLQAAGTTVDGAKASLVSPHGLTGDLAIVHPPGAAMSVVSRHDKPVAGGKIPDEPFGRAVGGLDEKGKNPSLYDTRSLCLKWEMPLGSSATWVFTVRGSDLVPMTAERLDDQGRVVRIKHGDGREVVACLSAAPFTWRGAGVDFAGHAGAVVRQRGTSTVLGVRSERCAEVGLGKDPKSAR